MTEAVTCASPESNSNGRALRIAAGAGFVALSVAGHLTEKQGWMDHWSHTPREIGNSIAHPAFGYFGAWIATRTKGYRLNVFNAVAATTVIDGLAEATQSAAYDNDHDPGKFLDDPGETLKDYIAALSGTVAFNGIDAVKNFGRKKVS